MRSAPRPAWPLWILTLVIAAIGLSLLVWDWSTPVPSGSFGVRGFSGLWAIGFGGVGALLTRRRPGHPVGWIFAAAGMLAAVVALVPTPTRGSCSSVPADLKQHQAPNVANSVWPLLTRSVPPLCAQAPA